MLSNIKSFTNCALSEKDTNLSFLPLSHVLGRCDSFLNLTFGCETIYAESIDKLLKLSGLTTQVEQFPSMITVGMEQAKQQGTPIPEAAYTSMVNSVNESILPSEIILGIKNSLMTTVNEKEAEKLLTWYESAIGIEITRAEKNAGTPGAYQKMMQMADSLMARLLCITGITS